MLTSSAINTLLQASLYIPLPFWFCTIFAPTWSKTQQFVASYLTLIPLCIMYTITLLPQLQVLLPLWNLNMTHDVLHAAMQQPALLDAVWFHTLTHDVLAATWIYKDSYNGVRLAPTSKHMVLTSIILLVCMNIGAPTAIICHLLRSKYL